MRCKPSNAHGADDVLFAHRAYAPRGYTQHQTTPLHQQQAHHHKKELTPPAELVDAIKASEDGSTAPPETELGGFSGKS
jgi:hypothetical protein